MSRAEISIVIITYNGAKRLPETLAALTRQSVPRERFTVIVIDDGSTDDSAAVAEAAGASVISLERNVGPGGARNAGLAAVETPIVAFIDDDCVAKRDWLEQIMTPFEASPIDGVAGRIRPVGKDGVVLGFFLERNPWAPLSARLLQSTNRWYRLWLYAQSLVAGADPGAGTALFAVAGGNMAFRVDSLKSVGGFDARLGVSEETDLCRRLHARPQGAQIVSWPGAEVGHRFDTALTSVLRRARWYGRGNGWTALTRDDADLIVYPCPVVALLALMLLIVSRRHHLLSVVALLPLVCYPRWPYLAARRRTARHLVHPYLQFVMELATMAGEVEVLLAHRSHSERSSHDGATAGTMR